jgi:hypothetical protein
MGLPQLVACLDVEKRQGEENGGVEQHQQILHGSNLPSLIVAEKKCKERKEFLKDS